MAKIRVDQSHCNFHLAEYFLKLEMDILFTDAGRVTRGGTGFQGLSLNIFVSNSLPIPDIVANYENGLIIVEVDNTLSKAISSIRRYRENSKLLLDLFSKDLGVDLDTVQIGFCFTGAKSDNQISRILSIDLGECDFIYAYKSPRNPLLIYGSHVN